MIKYCLLCFVLVVVFLDRAWCQGQNNHWYFGIGAGLDFSSGSPVSVLGSLHTNEGVAAISDANGNLLFYTNGVDVFNRNHAYMTNGRGLTGDWSSSQSALIVPSPANTFQYYIFTTRTYQQELGVGMRYSIVDMRLSDGLGAVTSSKNMLMHPNSTECITAVRSSNGMDIWIVGHEAGTNVFFSFLLTKEGVSASPVLSEVGQTHVPYVLNVGCMKANRKGNKIALAVGSKNLYELFDFDNASGLLSNPLTFLPGEGTVYGVEFSPDGSKLYFVVNGEFVRLYQVNLNAGSEQEILNSKVEVAKPNYIIGSLQLGPDHKIYLARYQARELGVINFPNRPGKECAYRDFQVPLVSSLSTLGLPGFFEVPCSFSPTIDLGSDTALCLNQRILLQGGQAATYKWSTGSETPSIEVAETGNYWLTGSNGNCTSSDTVHISIEFCPNSLEMPDLFTPNGDGSNDLFLPITYEGISRASVWIFNRWGERVYVSNKLTEGWDGTFAGNPCSAGIYYWVLDYSTINSESFKLNGTLHLFR
jgi:gliding motility-associated-like protein